ncbi:MAG: phosphopantothenoylcysteine decarboxylase, partial [bacterium]
DVKIVEIQTAEEMKREIESCMGDVDGYVGAAAVSDYRPEPEEGKIRSNEKRDSIPLGTNPDIISELSKNFPGKTMVGFSVDDSEDPSIALEKARDKNLDAIIFNALHQQDAGMGHKKNDITFCIPPDTRDPLGQRTKQQHALQIWLALLREGIAP